MIQQGTNVLREHSKSVLNFDGKLKQINFLDNRVYQRKEDVFYPSVTSILQYMPKNKFFENWIKDVGHNSDIIMRRAGKEGTQVHNAAEDLVLGKEVEWLDEFGNAKYNELVWNMILKFADFWNTEKPELISAEEFVYSDKYQYAGTSDLVVKMHGETWLLDIKTSNTLHKTFELQLAAYAKALWENKGIKIDRMGVIWLKASTRGPSNKKGVMQGKGWQIKTVDDIEENFELFELIHKAIKPAFKSYPISVKL